MQIKTIESFVVRIPFDDDRPFTESIGAPKAGANGDPMKTYPPVWRTKAVYTDMIEAVIVRIETDNGIVGWGECHTPVAGEITKAVIDQLLAPVVVGADPRDIHPLWEKMYATMRVRGQFGGYHLEAMSGVDIALWDILGKAVNAPISKLLGGKIRDRVPVYASCLPAVGEDGIDDIVSRAHALIEQGFGAFKIKLGGKPETDGEVLARLRSAVGKHIGIAVYVNGAYDFAIARRAGKLFQEFGVLWLEDPLAPENLRDYAPLAKFLDVAIAGGGSLNTRWQFNEYLAHAAFDLVQPDVSRAGGISECRRIAMLADTYGVPFAPHVSRGTAIYMAASFQWAASGTNLMTCEYPVDQNRAGDGILKQPFEFADGFVTVSDAPGLGIEINEDALMQWVS
ncbi:MAG: mandelate racemase/muconate lactonizing enzyme family protein [Aggregatilineales bacterium]